jgi:hypothetical protein
LSAFSADRTKLQQGVDGMKKGTQVVFLGLEPRIWEVERTVVGVGRDRRKPYACEIITRLLHGIETRRIHDVREVKVVRGYV